LAGGGAKDGGLLASANIASAFTPRLALVAATSGQDRVPGYPRGPRPVAATQAAQLLEGTWAPSVQRPPPFASRKAEPSREQVILQALSRGQVKPPPTGARGFGVSQRRPCSSGRWSSASTCVGGDGPGDLPTPRSARQVPLNLGRPYDSAATSARGEGNGARSRAGGSCVSHATTPSWRSRSFPPRLTGCGQGASSTLERQDADGKRRARRCPPLPMEARWAATEILRKGAPASELQRLDEVGSEVCEANAMLVESFLNVKRRMLENAGTSDYSEAISESCYDSYVP